jgi:RNA polymerase subunit RPABC4/transcription elongation factor Spt4
MKTHESEIIDLALSQAIERYMEMKPECVHDAITSEWHEQIAVILTEFFFRAACPKCRSTHDFIEMERENGGGNYVVSICGCE